MKTLASKAVLMPIFDLLMFAAIHSPAAASSITGSVRDPDGAPLVGAFVQLKNVRTGALTNVRSSLYGRYEVADLPAGEYDLTINVPGMKIFEQKGTVIEAARNLHLDTRLEDSESLRTLGEDPVSLAALFINRPPPPTGPAPRTADGKPDLSGFWLVAPSTLGNVEMLPWAEALTKARKESHSKDHPLVYCLPGDPIPLMSAGWYQFVQNPKHLVMIVEGDTPGFRLVFLDGRGHPKDFGPSWMGHAVGKWDGDALVMDLVGFRDRGWIDYEGHPHTDHLHVTERLRRPELGHLEIEITVDDSGAYRSAWTVKKTATLAPDEEIHESVCNENNKDLDHLVGN